MATSCERLTSKTSTLRSTSQQINFLVLVLVTGFVMLPMGSVAEAQLPDAQLIEWDCPLQGAEAPTPPVDPSPGALVADGDFVWFVTTMAQQRLVRFAPGAPKATALATCTWWDLDELTVDTGGIRLKPMGGIVYIRSFDNLQRIETATNRRTTWTDGLLSLSDVAVRTAGSQTQVFTTGFSETEANNVLQRVIPSSNGSADVRRWVVGGGAGDPFVVGSYLSGVDVPSESNKSHLVYYSEPLTNMIGELNTNTGVVRRWALGDVSAGPCDPFDASLTIVCQPRQLDAAFGMVWVVTGSGHIVRLNPSNNELFVAPIPTLGAPTASAFNNPIGISADGVIGYTAAGEVGGFNKVGMLVPSGLTQIVMPSSATAPIVDTTLAATPITVTRFAGPALPFVKNALAMQTETTGGTFFEANIDLAIPANTAGCGAPVDPDPMDEFVPSPDDPCMASTFPRGIDDDPKGNTGDYYAAIGGSTLRIAHVSLPTDADGMVTGGGIISATSTITNPITGVTTSTTEEKGTFGMVAMRKNGQPAKGHVTYHNHDSENTVISIELTDLTFVNNTAVVGGLCKTGSDCIQFRVDVADNGQPWSPTKDTFTIVKDPILGVGVGEGGELTGGNIKVHQQ